MFEELFTVYTSQVTNAVFVPILVCVFLYQEKKEVGGFHVHATNSLAESYKAELGQRAMDKNS